MSDPITPALAPAAAPPVAAPAPVAEAQPAAPAAAPAPAAPAPVAPTFANPYASRAAATAPVAEAAPPKPPAPTITDLHKTVAERDAELTKLRGEAASLHTAVSAHAARELASLPEQHRAAVQREAGDNPSEALRLIGLLRSVGAFAPAAVAPLPVGATTAPPPPSAAAPTVDPDAALLARYEQMKKVAPTHAQAFANANAAAIKRAQTRVS